jgi:hypothetical protein
MTYLFGLGVCPSLLSLTDITKTLARIYQPNHPFFDLRFGLLGRYLFFDLFHNAQPLGQSHSFYHILAFLLKAASFFRELRGRHRNHTGMCSNRVPNVFLLLLFLGWLLFCDFFGYSLVYFTLDQDVEAVNVLSHFVYILFLPNLPILNPLTDIQQHFEVLDNHSKIRLSLEQLSDIFALFLAAVVGSGAGEQVDEVL